jgi:hypothetical protein
LLPGFFGNRNFGRFCRRAAQHTVERTARRLADVENANVSAPF